MRLSDHDDKHCIFSCSTHEWPNGCSLLDTGRVPKCPGLKCKWRQTASQWDASIQKAYESAKKNHGWTAEEYVRMFPTEPYRRRARIALESELNREAFRRYSED